MHILLIKNMPPRFSRTMEAKSVVKQYLEAKILSIHPSTIGEDGTIYDQNIKILTKGGVELEIFDLDMLITEDKIGKFQKLTILTNNSWGSSKVEKVKADSPKILKITPRIQAGATDELLVIAKVKEITKEEDLLTVDCGFGNFIVEIQDDLLIFEELDVGDFIKFKTGRLDLYEVLD